MQPVSPQSIPIYPGSFGQPPVLGTVGSASGPAVPAVPSNTTGVMVVDRYRHKQSVKLGFIQVFVGLACVIFNSVALGILDKARIFGASTVGYGFWIGLTFISAGGLGIAAGKKRTKCTIIGFMVMCIISAALTTIMFSLGIVGSVVVSHRIKWYCTYSYNDQHHSSYAYRTECVDYRAAVAMEAFLAIAGVIEAIAAIWGAVICCKSGVCCCSSPQQTVVLPVSYYQNGGQVMFVPQAQGFQMIHPQPQVAVPFQHGLVVPPINYQTGIAAPPTWNNESGLPGNTPQEKTVPPPSNQNDYQLFQHQPGQGEKN